MATYLEVRDENCILLSGVSLAGIFPLNLKMKSFDKTLLSNKLIDLLDS